MITFDETFSVLTSISSHEYFFLQIMQQMESTLINTIASMLQNGVIGKLIDG